MGLSRDGLGLDYPDVETAYLEVFRAAQGVMCEFAARGMNPQDYAVEVENASGEVVFDFPFSEVSSHRVSNPGFPIAFRSGSPENRGRLVRHGAEPTRPILPIRY